MDQQLCYCQQNQCDKDSKPYLHISLDPSNLNQEVVRKPFWYRTSDDIFQSYHNSRSSPLWISASVTTILNLMKPIHFVTTFGNSRLTRIAFGLAVAGDAFQWELDTIFNNLNFCTGITNDMITWDDIADGSDSDRHLTKFLHHKTE